MNDEAPALLDPGLHLVTHGASTAAAGVDHLLLAMVLLCGGVALVITFLLFFFSIRYRQGSKADRSDPPSGARPLELAWTLTPLVIFLGVFVWSAVVYADLERPSADALPVYVVAKQWMWTLQHRSGRREINELHVPLGQPVQLMMTSQDVIHSFYVPAFRIKQDVVPGRYTTLRFTATRAGVYRLFCAEYCGTDHAAMQGRIVVMPPAEFARWLDTDVGPETTAARGRALFQRLGCAACHDAGATVQAPRLEHLMGSTVTLQDGRTVTADAAYVRDAMLTPRKDIVAGYAPIMPTYQGQIDEEDIVAIIEYLRTSGAANGSPGR